MERAQDVEKSQALLFSESKSSVPLTAVVLAKQEDGHDKYNSVLSGRYVSEAMSKIWSDDNKWGKCRKMWATLARIEKELGADITAEQVAELEAAVTMPIDYAYAAKQEKELRHDVMAHINTLAQQCPTAAPIIHLGATSCDITDNAELLQIREAMILTLKNGLNVLNALHEFAQKHAEVVTLSYTHGQPAQLTTVGKRACMWAESLRIALKKLKTEIDELPLRGFKGATGTQATFLALFDGDADKVDILEELLCRELDFEETLDATGQTYHRIIDHFVLAPLIGVGATLAKMCEDIRFLASHGEMNEPFEAKQVGSSAQPYKQNPMRCERADGLARLLLGFGIQPALTAAVQWSERSLDDSSNRRVTIADAFMLTDAILCIAANVVPGLRVNQGCIARRVNQELPFMATEQIILDSVQHGGNRQHVHEAIREHAVAVAAEVKEQGLPNNLIARICADERFPQIVRDELKVKALDPKDYLGTSVRQVARFTARLQEFMELYGFDSTQARRAELKV